MEATIIRHQPTHERIDPVALSCLEAMLRAVLDARRTLIVTVDRYHDALVARAEHLDELLRAEDGP